MSTVSGKQFKAGRNDFEKGIAEISGLVERSFQRRLGADKKPVSPTILEGKIRFARERLDAIKQCETHFSNQLEKGEPINTAYMYQSKRPVEIIKFNGEESGLTI